MESYTFDSPKEALTFLDRNVEKFEFDIDIFKLNGISAVPHVIYRHVSTQSHTVCDLSQTIHGDILKNITIEGRNIRGYLLTFGKITICQSSFSNLNRITIDLGKIGIIYLLSRFCQLKLEVYSDSDILMHQNVVILPSSIRRSICCEIEMIDDSILNGLVYKSGAVGVYPGNIIFDWRECYHIRRIIESKQKDDNVWLEAVPEITELIRKNLKRLNIDETISGDKVTLGCYSAGDSFFKHKDYPLQGGSKTLLIYLNFTEGGETVFEDFKVNPATGRYIIFGIYDEHEMLRLLRGNKYIVACELI